MTEDFYKEIELIQSCVTRMAQNSFTIKGLSLTCISLVGAILVDNILYVKVALLLPIIAFWWLDAYYLHRERLFRKLYNWVVENRLSENKEYLFDLNPNRFIKDEISLVRCMFRQANLMFYGMMLILFIFYCTV